MINVSSHKKKKEIFYEYSKEIEKITEKMEK